MQIMLRSAAYDTMHGRSLFSLLFENEPGTDEKEHTIEKSFCQWCFQSRMNRPEYLPDQRNSPATWLHYMNRTF